MDETGDYDLSLRQKLDLSLQQIGEEREPVLLVEGILSNPQSLVRYACEEVPFKPVWGPNGGYPGIRAPAPLNYVGDVVRRLSPMIERAFGLSNVKLARAECSLSLVTLRPEQLTPLQRIPHVDTVDAHQFALLHYLCGPEHGGTAFYRHRATGFETLTSERQPEYFRVRDAEIAEATTASDYIRGDSPHYEQTAAFEATFDRLLIYRSRALHSGLIPAGAELSDDPRTGRLTANIFVNYARR